MDYILPMMTLGNLELGLTIFKILIVQIPDNSEVYDWFYISSHCSVAVGMHAGPRFHQFICPTTAELLVPNFTKSLFQEIHSPTHSNEVFHVFFIA